MDWGEPLYCYQSPTNYRKGDVRVENAQIQNNMLCAFQSICSRQMTQENPSILHHSQDNEIDLLLQSQHNDAMSHY